MAWHRSRFELIQRKWKGLTETKNSHALSSWNIKRLRMISSNRQNGKSFLRLHQTILLKTMVAISVNDFGKPMGVSKRNFLLCSVFDSTKQRHINRVTQIDTITLLLFEPFFFFFIFHHHHVTQLIVISNFIDEIIK